MIATNQTSGSPWATVGQEPCWPIPRCFWDSPQPIEGTQCTGAVGTLEFKGKLYALYDHDNALKMVAWDGGSWSAEQAIPGESEGRPALAVFGNKLWVFSAGTGSGTLSYRTFDGETWMGPTEIGPAAGSGAAAVFKKKLTIVYPDENHDIVFRSWTGKDWSEPGGVGGSSSLEPAACAQGDKLRVLYTGGDGALFMTTFDGSSWSDAAAVSDINGAGSARAPAVVLDGEGLEVLYRGGGSASLWSFRVRGDGSPSGQRRLTNDARTEMAMGLATYGSDVFAVFKGQNDDRLVVMRRPKE
jgi:hypothetical protein